MIERQLREQFYAEVAAHMNRVADIWERDGSDPCRVRVTREYANAYRAYAEGYGEPGRLADAPVPKTKEEKIAFREYWDRRYEEGQRRAASDGPSTR